jgi:hypothetical protein
MQSISNGTGISIFASNYNIIGRAPPGAGNVISGNHGTGVELTAGSRNNVLSANYIGVAADGVSWLGNLAANSASFAYGVYSSNGSNQYGHGENNSIGGTGAGQGNVIAYNSDGGVVLGGGTGNSVRSNAIFGNDNLGIDLGANGPTPNDPGDTDAGGNVGRANDFQNYPALESVTFSGGTVKIRGTLNSAPDTSYSLEFFATDKNVSDAFIQGGLFLGSSSVTTNATGNGAFEVQFSVPNDNCFISSTATDPNGNTSEFGGIPDPLANISTRLAVKTGDDVLIGGFIVTGTESKRVVIRAIGPSLSQFGVDGALQDPTLQLFQGGTLLGSNDDWKESEADIQPTGLAPSDSAEAALLRTLAPGNYTAVVRGKNDTTGVALVEAYDLDPSPNSKLANISTRGFVDHGDSVMIGGFILPAVHGGGTRVVVRALGPSLSNFGVVGALPDPILELFDGNGNSFGYNNDWRSQQETELQQSGLAPASDSESAIIVTLPAGNYTAIVSADLDLPGIGLVEVYNLQ